MWLNVSRCSRHAEVPVNATDLQAGVNPTIVLVLAGASITEVEGSHVIMISQPQAVTDVILTAATATADTRR